MKPVEMRYRFLDNPLLEKKAQRGKQRVNLAPSGRLRDDSTSRSERICLAFVVDCCAHPFGPVPSSALQNRTVGY